MFAWYSNKLETHPLTTKCLTSGLISAVGDVSCQKLFDEEDENKHKSKKEWDMIRTARMSFLGFAFIAPGTHYWYSFLMRNIPEKTIKATIKRLCMDQLLFSPIFLSAWIYSNMTLQGFDSKAILAQLKLDYWDMLKANWGLWVPAQTINLGIVPGRYQVLFGNMVGLLWGVYLSYKGGGSKGVKSGDEKSKSN